MKFKQLIFSASISAAFTLTAFFSGCAALSDKKGLETKEEMPVVCGVEYAAPQTENFHDWLEENRNSDGVITNKATTQTGIVRSPYFTLTANGVSVPVYAERTAAGAHSFAYIDLDGLSDGARFSLNLNITTHIARSNPVVLPESAGIKAVADGREVSATVTDYGVYTFSFDKSLISDGADLPLTLTVKKKEAFSLPEGYELRTFLPGRYMYETTRFMKTHAAYYFKKGYYEIEGMTLPSDSVFYFEEGTVLAVKALTLDSAGNPLVSKIFEAERYGKNIRFYGRPAIDFSERNGSNDVYKEDAGSGAGYNFGFLFEYTENVEFSGVNAVNSGSWTCCFSASKNVEVRDLVLLGYRTYSDGVMISDCENVTVRGCFVRTGDDAMEVKSTTAGHVAMKNVVFEQNSVWTDKGVAYGAVYETANDIQGVTWRNNSVGYALPHWSDHLACTTISMEGSTGTTDSDLHFENIEIYTTYCPVTTVVLHNGGTVSNVYFKDVRVKYLLLHQRYRGAIDFIVYNKDGGDIDDFAIKTVYFDKIDLAGTALTQENKKKLITTKFAEGFAALFNDYRFIKVNTLG